MTEYIFRSKQNDDQDGLYYCLSGNEDFIDDQNNPRINKENDPRVVAKAVQNKKSKHITESVSYYRYYLKTNPNLEIFNPIEYHSSIKEKKLFSHVHAVCKNTWTFKEVDKSLFDKYIIFLKTKNIQSLRDIERQLK